MKAGKTLALERCRQLLAELHIDHDADLAAEIVQAALRLAADKPGRADMKLVLRALKELRYGFKMFRPYHDRRKVSIFGSARTARTDPDYQTACDFGRQIATAGFMVITGAGSGIMEAGHEGAGQANSFGVAIKLPFEQETNPVIAGDEKLAHFRYFFSRKLMFVKETHAVALFPGGFGTHDEAFELLTLVQTGRANPMPLVMIERPGGDYWPCWERFVRENLLRRNLISPEDTALWTITDNVRQAVDAITTFYRNYHSLRFRDGQIIMRIRHAPDESEINALRHDFADLFDRGTLALLNGRESEPAPVPVPEMPRLVFEFNRRSPARLYMLIDRLNRLGRLDSTPDSQRNRRAGY